MDGCDDINKHIRQTINTQCNGTPPIPAKSWLEIATNKHEWMLLEAGFIGRTYTDDTKASDNSNNETPNNATL